MTEQLTASLGLLREIRADELELMLSWRNAPAVRANMYTQHLISLEEHLAWWQRVSTGQAHRYFMYEYQGSALGIVGFTDIHPENRNSSWAFYAAPEAPHGTGSRMEYLALEHAFHQLALHKLNCEVLAFNSAVIKLHQKFGFSVEGIFRENFQTDTGFVDVYRLGLLQREWQAKSGAMLQILTERTRT